MKRPIYIVALCAIAAMSMAELVPDLLTGAWYRTNVVASSAAVTLYKGATLRLTNCVAHDASGAAQNLTDCGIVVSIGDNSTNATAYGTAQDATGGVFTADAMIPYGGTEMRVEVKLTNAATIYIYPAYNINVKASL